MDKNKLKAMFGIETYRELATELQLENDSLVSQVAHYKVKCEDLEAELKIYKMSDEEKMKYLMEDTRELEELYKRRITEYEALIQLASHDVALAEEQLDMLKKKEHSIFAEGRRTAFNEMGIRNIQAKKNGNEYVATWDDDDLIDIVELPAEIEIDDLVGVTE